MLTNYLKTAIRNIVRERQYAIIKVIGLGLGLGTSLTLMLYISHQLSFDQMHPDLDRTYRVNQTAIWGSNGIFSSTGPAVAAAFEADFPEIENVVRLYTPGNQLVRYQSAEGSVAAYNETNVLAADSTFFSFFGFKLKEGDPRTALVGADKVVISDDAATRLFGDEPALGKIIQMGDSLRAVEVTGVTERQPDNVHFRFDYLTSMGTYPVVKEFEWSWIWTQVVTYIKVKPGTDVKALTAKVEHMPDRWAVATFERFGMDYKVFSQEKGGWKVYLQPLADIHLYSARIGNRVGTSGDIQYVKVLGIITAFILLIAVVNFVNLSTARGSKRAKEVGVKKTLGAMRHGLIIQFQVEHILIALFSMLLGLGFMELLRMSIEPVVGISIPLHTWSLPAFIGVVIVLPIVIGFIAGLYPSFYLTSFRPAKVLKGMVATGFASSGLRNALVVFQFAISISLMAATLIVFQQLEFFQSMNLGYNKDNLLVINNAEKLGNQLESFRDEVAQYSGVTNAAVSMNIRSGFEDIYSKEGDNRKITINGYKADSHFLETIGLPLAAGRNFDILRPSDKKAVVISETTARVLGWSAEEAVGKRIEYLGDDIGLSEVIGVTRDFHFQSLRENIMPTMFFHISSPSFGNDRIVLVRFEPGRINELVNQIKARWAVLHEAPFSYSILDEQLMKNYQQEEKMAGLFTIFTILSITIAVIGLVGLVAYSAEQRKKEIGIRKVFGASLGRIYLMINKQYVQLLVVAMAIATPVTWYYMQEWLDTWAYPVKMNPLIFAAAGIGELLLALACVGYLALKAAMLNPTSVLKDE